MTGEGRAAREPLFQISRRDAIAWWKAWLIRILALALSLCACAVVIYALTSMTPIEV